MHLNLLLAAYLCGGLTFLPLVIFCFFLYGLVVFPRRDEYARRASTKASAPSLLSEKEEDTELKEKLKGADRGADVAAGYFAVCREYVPAGVNGKPPERTTPAGETIAAESPSVYQSMYRSIFDRNKSQGPTMEAGKSVKRARNVFYVVLRHGHLMLFDNSDQLEVRHVISLTHYDVDIYGGDAAIPEGELYIKRNCIRLLRQTTPDNATANLAPFYMFSDNCSEKEDFYHALLQSQRKFSELGTEWPENQEFDTEDMIKLFRQLHLPEENTQNRWLNALAGRVFLALYKTSHIEQLVRNKITKKISRVQKPAFITSLTLEDVSMGESAPSFGNTKLKEITVDGNVLLETDVKYSGKFRAVIAAVAKLELGQRFKPREVDLVLAGDLRRLEGHMLIRIKPPPSNRVWFCFETMPKMEMAIEPIVSSRQITYGIIIRAIESRIREVFGETLVYPNWDDIPFTDTEAQHYRGGIWKTGTKTAPSLAASSTADKDETETPAEGPAQETTSDHERSLTMPELRVPRSVSTYALLESEKLGEGDRLSQSPAEATTPITLPRSNSFAAPATASPAIVTKIPVMSNKTKKKAENIQRDAASAMKSLNTRSQDSSPLNTPSRLPRSSPISRSRSWGQSSGDAASNSEEASDRHHRDDEDVSELSSPTSPGIVDSPHQQQSEEVVSENGEGIASGANGEASLDKKLTMNQSLMSATAAARKWGLEMMQRNKESMSGGSTTKLPRIISTGEPIGRGQPLPPPGEPLPGPADSRSWTTGAFGSLKRKPVASSSTNSTPTTSHQKSSSISSISSISNFFTGSSSSKDTEKKNSSTGELHDEPAQLEQIPAAPPSPGPLSSHPTTEEEEEAEIKQAEPKIKQS